MDAEPAPIVVVYADDPAAAVRAAERASQRPPWEIVPLRAEQPLTALPAGLPDDADYVWTGTQLLDVHAALAVVALPDLAPPAAITGASRDRRSPVPGALLVTGISLLGVGGVSAVIGENTRQKYLEGVPGENPAVYSSRVIALGAGTGMRNMGLTACAIGAVSVTVALPFVLHKPKASR